MGGGVTGGQCFGLRRCVSHIIIRDKFQISVRESCVCEWMRGADGKSGAKTL